MPLSVQQAAKQLRDRGFAICKPDRKQKKPTYKEWPTYSLEMGHFNGDDSIGILAGPLSNDGKAKHALVIIDLDSPESLEVADHYLPPTDMIEGRPGKTRSHRYYLIPFASIPNWAISHAPQAAPAAMKKTGHAGPVIRHFTHRETKKVVFDFLGTGGQAVCPPSRHESGERREWEGGRPGNPAIIAFLDLWDSVCRLASRCSANIPPADEQFNRKAICPTSDVVNRASKYLAKMPEAVSGQRGHDRTFAAACTLVQGFALDSADAFRLLAEEYNPRCSPPWTERELRHKIEDAANAVGNKPFGHLRDSVLDRNGQVPPSLNGKLLAKTPEPEVCEAVDNPHRLAQRFLESVSPPSGLPFLLRNWRGEFHRWEAGAYKSLLFGDVRNTVTAFVREEFLRLNRIEIGLWESSDDDKKDKPIVRPVTRVVINNVLQAVESMAALSSSIDQPAWINNNGCKIPPSEVVSAPNGLFTLPAIADGQAAFSPPTPDFFTPNVLPFEVPASAPSPNTWIRCLNQWFSGDAASIAGLQEWFGYFLTHDTSTHKILFLIGPPRSGKGTIIHTLTELVGPSNTASTSFTNLSNRFGLQDLIGKRLAVIPDARIGHKNDTAAVIERLLSISGEDPQSVDRKGLPLLSVKIPARFLIASNEIPRLPDSSGAIASRFHIIALPNSWLGKEDHDLRAKLAPELPGILKWAAEGWLRLRAQDMSFTMNSAAEDHQQELEDLASPIRAFVRECCTLGPDCSEPVGSIFQAWKRWNEMRGRKVPSANIFSRDLSAAFRHIQRKQPREGEKRTRVFMGIAVRPEIEWEDSENWHALERVPLPPNAYAREGSIADEDDGSLT